ncbi:helix-turn-helix domain-containing protein [Thioalkalivibrio sp. XN279]|uniref:helix-turn-helix transcriptional regulator n=1 Tax=Thioalkalivibrio sp. XN279 TaxID=2714953 RepID=UPI00140B8B91|nr:response regulator transcription factor [Thioalkalivibrio sp. XN279]NHA15758.1 response regulator transcription factor [Thioalkalivibrio sp. XN279]
MDAFSGHAEILHISASLRALGRLDVKRVAAAVFDLDAAPCYDPVAEFKRAAASIPLVLLTSKVHPTLLLWALRGGIRDVLAKPLDAADVVRVWRELGELQRLRRAGLSRREALMGRSHDAKNGEPVGGTATNSRPERIAAQIRNYVGRHLQDDIAMDDIAAACGCSRNECNNVAKKQLGGKLKSFVVAERIAHARKLLVATDLPIAEIAERSGFHESAYFCRTFRQHCGESPSCYRARFRSGPPAEDSD